MLIERETIVSLFIALVAVLVIVGGFASFSGLAVYSQTLSLDSAKDSFSKGDAFDVDVVSRPAMFLKDESLVLYIDDNIYSVISLQKYLDDNGIDYGLEYHNTGSNNIPVINLEEKLKLNLAEFIDLEDFQSGSYVLKVTFSEEDASAEMRFKVE